MLFMLPGTKSPWLNKLGQISRMRSNPPEEILPEQSQQLLPGVSSLMLLQV